MHQIAIEHFSITFAGLFSSLPEQERVAREVFDSTIHINFNGSALDVWQDIIIKATNQERIVSLMECRSVITYNNNPDLMFCKLLWLVEQLPFEMSKVLQLYDRCTTRYRLQRDPKDKPKDFVQILFKLQPHDTRPRLNAPVLEFVARLSVLSSGRVCEQLQSLVEKGLVFLQSSDERQQVERVLKLVKGELAESHYEYITVTIDPPINQLRQLGRVRQQDRATYILKIVHWDHVTPSQTPWYQSVEPSSLNQIQFTIDQVLRTHLGDSTKEIVLEFFLPEDLLLGSAKGWKMPDQWLIPNSKVPGMRLGDRYQIVYRSLDRLNNPDYMPAWHRKWQIFQSARESFSDDLMLWVSAQSQYNGKTLHNRIIGQQYTFVGFAFKLSKSEKELFYGKLMAGIPIAIWLRSHEIKLDLNELKLKIPCHAVCNLPQMLLKWRISDDVQEQFFANQVTLLWDDPERIPDQEKSRFSLSNRS